MRDKVSIPRVAQLHPLVADEVACLIREIELCFPRNICIRVTQGLRTFPEQTELYAIGRSKPGKKITNAKAGQSYHNYGLAFDFVILEDGKTVWDHKYNPRVVLTFKQAGWKWGGDFQSLPDKPHFKKTFGFHWSQLLERYKNKHFIPGTQYLKL